MVTAKTRAKIVDALMALAAERRWEEVTLEALAERAGVTLAELRSSYDGRVGVLAEFVRRIDEEVLAGVDAGMAAEPPRERLFDVLFSRIEALKPHKPALRNIGRAACRDPLLALALNGTTIVSMSWMLTAAGISSAGARGLVRAQALALVYARVMRIFLDDDDPGLARTMAALDKRLREVERSVVCVDRLKTFVKACGCRPARRGAQPVGEEGDLAEGHPS